jgi:hypothetical protein
MVHVRLHIDRHMHTLVISTLSFLLLLFADDEKIGGKMVKKNALWILFISHLLIKEHTL